MSSALIGVLTGEGIGPEVIAGALEVLRAVEQACGLSFEVVFGGPIGREAERRWGCTVPEEAVAFCADVFARGGAILNGPAGGRYVYDMRKRFDLFFKISPLQVAPELCDAGRLKPEGVRGLDVLIVRENVSGLYQGQWSEGHDQEGLRTATHAFEANEAVLRRFLAAAARLAAKRSGELTVVFKESGVPTVSALWRDCALQVAAAAGVRCTLLDVDHAAYRLIQHPRELDVVAAPNMFGDVLADLGAVLLGSRGLSFSGNYDGNGAAIYQTNHGAAYDLAGTNRANPGGQMLSLAMMLRESFGQHEAAGLIEAALRTVWRDGWRTEDLAGPGGRVTGTREMSELVVAAVGQLAPRRHGLAQGLPTPCPS